MVGTTRSARLTGPVPYPASSGKKGNLPLGPCLVERIDAHLIDIIWGAQGQSSTLLTVEDVEAAAHRGSLVLLD